MNPRQQQGSYSGSRYATIDKIANLKLPLTIDLRERLPSLRDVVPEQFMRRGHPPMSVNTHVFDRRSSPSSGASSPSSESASSATFTPTSSRHGSIGESAFTAANAQRLPIRPGGSRKRPASGPDPLATPSDSEDATSVRNNKAGKERENRRKQASDFHHLEDAMQLFLNLSEGQLQSPGNSVAAGLDMDKRFVLDAGVTLTVYFLQIGYKQALRENRVAEWREELRQHLQQAQRAENPLVGSWLDLPAPVPDQEVRRHGKGRASSAADEECERDGKGKGCKTHGRPDWRACRKIRRSAAFQYHRDRYLRQL